MRNICIVDDDDAVRDSLRVLLESHMLSVADFRSGDALLAEADLNEFDCFVLDFHMPGMNGLELLEALRTRGIGRAAIFMSALAVTAGEDRMRDAGVIATLMKPVPESELLGWIRRAVEPAEVARP